MPRGLQELLRKRTDSSVTHSVCRSEPVGPGLPRLTGVTP